MQYLSKVPTHLHFWKIRYYRVLTLNITNIGKETYLLKSVPLNYLIRENYENQNRALECLRTASGATLNVMSR